MSTVLPTRWPVAVDTAQALGYLLARHIPIGAQPHGARMIREAAGWVDPDLPRPDHPDVSPARARSWLTAARRHARLLGPPPDLIRLLNLLADGVIRSRAAAHTLLGQAGAGEVADPRVLVDFARWCGVDPPFQVVPLGAREGRRVYAYLRSVDDLVRARAVVDLACRRQGVVAIQDVLNQLRQRQVRIDRTASGQDLRDLLSVRGSTTWWWPHRHIVTPLTATLQRLHALGSPVPLTRVPHAVARARASGWPTSRAEGPLPTEAVRHWVLADPEWELTAPDSIHPVGQLADLHPHDRVVLAAVPAGQVLTWKAVQTVLIELGVGSSTAGVIIRHSPLLCRTTHGYALILGSR